VNIANPYLHSSRPLDAHHRALKRWATIASLSVATLLVTVKFFAYMVTDSVSLLSSLMDSAFDGLASVATMISVAHAATPADEDHRFGHGKVEALSALAQAVFIFGSAIFLLFESMHRFAHPVKVHAADTGIYVIIFSIALTGALVVFQQYVIRKTSSVAISADYLHYRGDLFMNLAVFAALVFSYYSPWLYFDPALAAIIALTLLFGAKKISHESFDILMDREIPDSEREKIVSIARAHPLVRAVHDLRTRSTGLRVFIEFHVEMDGDLPLRKTHDVTEELEKALYDAFPKAEVIIHQEPAGLDDHRIDSVVAEKKI
jgi:ferrous-iron efflux pump FieF